MSDLFLDSIHDFKFEGFYWHMISYGYAIILNKWPDRFVGDVEPSLEQYYFDMPFEELEDGIQKIKYSVIGTWYVDENGYPDSEILADNFHSVGVFWRVEELEGVALNPSSDLKMTMATSGKSYVVISPYEFIIEKSETVLGSVEPVGNQVDLFPTKHFAYAQVSNIYTLENALVDRAVYTVVFKSPTTFDVKIWGITFASGNINDDFELDDNINSMIKYGKIKASSWNGTFNAGDELIIKVRNPLTIDQFFLDFPIEVFIFDDFLGQNNHPNMRGIRFASVAHRTFQFNFEGEDTASYPYVYQDDTVENSPESPPSNSGSGYSAYPHDKFCVVAQGDFLGIKIFTGEIIATTLPNPKDKVFYGVQKNFAGASVSFDAFTLPFPLLHFDFTEEEENEPPTD